MAIRVTSGMMSMQTLNNLNRNYSNMNKMENQITTGRKLNKPSDDPVGVTYALRYRSELASNEQYSSNADAAVSWLDFTDSTMQQAGDVMKRLKELTVQASSETVPQSGLDAIKLEVDQLKEQMTNIGNSQIRGKYIFNGQKYDQAPYELTSTTTSYDQIDTDQGAVNYAIGDQSTFQVNTPGSEFFGASTDADNVFKVMDNLSAALTTGNYSAISVQSANIESRFTKMQASLSEVGARTNRVQLVQSRLDDRNLNLTTLQSKTEDADIASLMIQATSAQTIYEAALKSSAQIVQPSLMDFMR
ncbi:flagellar hook-associated protein FlgL [Paenibacillus sp. EKM102P]|uniref:flagellar hook-associated protein FlgL n=1 Tax=unclassified Paenibacillus TaxID=185978 RepID=UPI00142E9178|nr:MULTISPECIES: flagellar hook-associated protein FlgL [unclassified Paenibacillus]KAF6621137.1 flagellar hook-associated protein FlgL [Paenibacillus sp. EKM101P]KAF6622441.1 flagellar hook-associated protein FlgL [Paenibacillus sp. EKM102P]KAF6632290.1 flagellar hook-associated protein FlgL [Paenibacillus sp. EKM10P]KAF6647045.1 flagellar hook-associated protein FlgL [Paenibacillus sp. EKM11P]